MLLYLNGRNTRSSLKVRRIVNLNNVDCGGHFSRVPSEDGWTTHCILLQSNFNIIRQYTQ